MEQIDLASADKDSQVTARISYDGFIFMDNLTNNKIVLRDIRDRYGAKSAKCKASVNDQSEMQRINESISLLKSTKTFQMSALKSKIFKFAFVKETEHEVGFVEQKKRLRELIDFSIAEMSMKQLREGIKNRDYKINRKIMALQKINGRDLTKKSFIKLIQKISSDPLDNQNQTLQKSYQLKYPGQTETNEEPQLEPRFESELLQKGETILQNALKDSSYLVNCSLQRQLYQRMHRTCNLKEISTMDHHKCTADMDREFLSNYRFHQVTLASTINKMKAKTFHASKKPSRDEEEILNAAKNNVAQRVVMLLGMDTQLVKTLDNKGNSLLHITAKNRNLQLFESVLKRTGLQGLTWRNNLNKTPLDLAKIYAAEDIVKLANRCIASNSVNE